MVFNEFEILENTFNLMPELDVDGVKFKHQFEFGSHEDLLKFLELKRRGDAKTYPLIWLETPYKVERDTTSNGTAPTNLIIANLSNQDMLNRQRMETSFKKVLMPVLDDMLKVLKYGKATSYDEYDTTYFFNYAPSEKEGSDIWDVIKLELVIKYKKNCLIKKP